MRDVSRAGPNCSQVQKFRNMRDGYIWCPLNLRVYNSSLPTLASIWQKIEMNTFGPAHSAAPLFPLGMLSPTVKVPETVATSVRFRIIVCRSRHSSCTEGVHNRGQVVLCHQSISPISPVLPKTGARKSIYNRRPRGYRTT